MDLLVKENRNICIIGKGSIGIRHGRILSKLGFKIFFLRQRKKKLNIKINYKYKDIYKINDLKRKKFNLYIISNPSSKHIDALSKIISNNLSILIEKPIASNILDLNKMKKLYEKFNINLFPGYQLRFDPRVKLMRKIINKRNKNLRYANFKLKTFFPNWHPWENYKISYASQKKLGGGVLLTCSHEIDLAIHFFGKVKSVLCVKTISKFKTNGVENSIILIIKHKKNGFISTLNLDFAYKNKEERLIDVIFEDSELKYDLIDKKLFIKKNYKSKILKPKNLLNRDGIFRKQNLDILSKIKSNNFRKPNFDNISQAEKVIFAAKKSIVSNKFEQIK
tara:strand:- start:7405 stop:8412 length:1008 start_codon:yes stop_codon:yes gene_type:complete